MYLVWLLIIILTLILLVVAFVLTFSVPLSQIDFQPLSTSDGYLIVDPTSRKISLSPTSDTLWNISSKYEFIYGYTNGLGILCMSAENNVSGQICNSSDIQSFYIQGNVIKSNGSCLVNNSGIISLGSCDNALTLN